MKHASERPADTAGGAASRHADRDALFASHETGYAKHLKPRHVQMIAMGGAIGTGLFLGAGGRLQHAGPALALVYLVCGIFAFLIMRALGELVMHRPTSGSFVSYAREFMGERASFVAGWMYYLNWATTGIVDITAVAIYMKYWAVFSDVPQWVFALGALAIVSTVNMIGVKMFGEMEFWFSLIKVGALGVFLLVGSLFLASGRPLDGHLPGLHLIADGGGIFPHGLLPAVLIVQGVVFAYASIELVGVAAGETADARKVLPKAINSVMWRIALFYVGSVVLLVTLLPWSAYSAHESPFVTFFGKLGVPYVSTVMNVVVLTAAMSSLNSGLYSMGRVLRAMAMGGSAPRFVSRMSARGVPYGGILFTVAINAIGVPLNYIVPAQAFEIVLNMASLGIIATWGFIVMCQILFRRKVKRGELSDVPFRMPGAPFTSWLTLAFLLAVLVLMAFDYPGGTWTIAMIPVVALALTVGWRLAKRGSTREAAAMHRSVADRVNQA
ncbi:L-asparagine permease [Burkholderia ubonensis]|uniref:amino acid permease n=1 Tax=Burkholderia ubonensis TaxID=101571 RepID=UPI000752609D|nr:amino acid permease [Burkholderia ubonensis]KUZ92162.1 L-asparagine permease [Burkholderia ubonensis]KVA20639.1 L-asparagine permease [Burkholderia ubonensis]KVA31287.1 L-asparagine permease [Burkholderia ubonensis]KVA50996.1 L-asparagine permease [Burkholderia ubonensis]KVC58554.1 L-asparagine permease [Burkholderia ubonensis]